MLSRFCTIASSCWIAALVGCANNQTSETGGATPEDSGWTRIGQVAVPQGQDQDVVRAGHLTGAYGSIRFEANGPAEIHRVVVTYDTGATYLPEHSFTFEKAGSQVLELPGGQHKIDRVALVYSGGRLFRKTTVVLWAK